MNREKFKKDFLTELAFFNFIAINDLDHNFTIEQVEDELVKFSSSFYGARLEFDEYAVKKCYFVAMYPYEIIKGKRLNEYLDKLCDDIIEEKRIRELRNSL